VVVVVAAAAVAAADDDDDAAADTIDTSLYISLQILPGWQSK
jgi:hypothetical protein